MLYTVAENCPGSTFRCCGAAKTASVGCCTTDFTGGIGGLLVVPQRAALPPMLCNHPLLFSWLHPATSPRGAACH